MRKEAALKNRGIPNKVFVKMIPFPASDWKKKCNISYSLFNSRFGKIIVASLPQGVCYVGFALAHNNNALTDLHSRFPNALFQRRKNKQHEHVKRLFLGNWEKDEKLVLCLKGTTFQLKVWEALLEIPTGNVSSYGKIAAAIGYPKAQRAVGTAVGRNPILYLIPCHRVIAQNGKMGGFFWGIEKKITLLNVENAGYLHFTSSFFPSTTLRGVLKSAHDF